MTQSRDVAELNSLYQDYWEFLLRENPRYATYLGEHRYDDKLEDASEAAYNRQISQYQKYLGQLRTFSKPSSSPDRLNYELFDRTLSNSVKESIFKPYLLPINQQNGPHIEVPQLTSYHPFHTIQDYENYTTRLGQFPRLIDQVLANMKKGISEKIVLAKINAQSVPPQLDAQIVKDVSKSPFYEPVTKPPKTIPTKDVEQLRESLEDTLEGKVIPAYKKLRSFIKTDYIPACRNDIGLWSMPDGKERYDFYVRYYTTTSLTPTQIHALGIKQLARIHKEMRAIMKRVGFKGSLQAFAQSIQNDKRQYYPNGKQLMEGFKKILAKMDKKLPLLFGHLPKGKYSFREIEAYRASAAPAAYYYTAPEDHSRPGYFYVNTYRPETRPKFIMEALAYHEAVPGHHTQLAIQQELTNLPRFRRYYNDYTVFVEGWALYSEQLPKEVGFYQDPYSDFGRLTLEAWRAARLVVDTGIHAQHWTRPQAIKFFKENTALSDQNIVSEVDRYIAWPGQALAYMIGQLKIRELRAKAEKKQGKHFDVRKFHDELLRDGALPVDVLERKMNLWLNHPIRNPNHSSVT
jgi:uncharacterized protein (DUF885 family)